MIGYEDKRKKMREIDCLKDGGNTNGDRQRVVYKESEREREREREKERENEQENSFDFQKCDD